MVSVGHVCLLRGITIYSELIVIISTLSRSWARDCIIKCSSVQTKHSDGFYWAMPQTGKRRQQREIKWGD